MRENAARPGSRTQFLEVLLEAEVFARDASGSRNRIHKNVCFFGPPGTGKRASRSRWRSRPARPATASPSRPPSNGSTASSTPSTATRSTPNSAGWSRYSLLVADEIGYLPLERQAANLLFALVARRYERGSIIVTSNRGFEAWGEILGDAMVAAALIDRLIHPADDRQDAVEDIARSPPAAAKGRNSPVSITTPRQAGRITRGEIDT